MANPTHLSLYFMRSLHMRREHLLGEAQDGSLTTVVKRGDTRKVQFVQAQHLLCEESALEDKTVNRDRVEADRAEVKALADAEREAVTKSTLKKAA